MKQIYLTLTMLAAATAATAQVVTTSPAIVQRSTSPIVITFHADQGNKGLAGLTASTPVYAHTGVIMAGSEEWTKAPGWLDNSDKYKLDYVSANTWQLTIPSINEYYGTTASDDVARLAFVFRNANGSREGKTANGNDIFVDVMPDGFAVQVTSDATSSLLSAPTEVGLTVNTTDDADISLYVDSTELAPFATATNVSSLSSSYKISTVGNTSIIAVAKYQGKTYTDHIDFCLVGPSQQADYPGGVPKMGPVKMADGSVIFCIGAPEKNSVMIMGSWNDYAYNASQVMNYQDYEGNRYFWTVIPSIADGKDYIYWFVIDNSMSVGDPYARLVLDPRNDKYISETTFPNMPEYPSAIVDGVPLAVYNSTADDYDWQVTDFKGPDQSQLLVYELLIRDFSGTEGQSRGEGTIAGVMDKLDYLQDLGVNAIEFLPIMEFNGNNSWGYNTNFYFAPDKAYGTPDDYRALFDAIHARGMAVILDIVFNQSDGMHPWYQMYPISKNPFYNGTAPHSYSVLNDWNQDNPLVQQQFKDALKYWLEAYKVDGFRFDLVKGLGSNASYSATYNASNNTWSNVTEAKTNAYNASRVTRMKELHDAMREVAPDAYFINENLAGAQEENQMAQDGEINWANINDASCQFAMGYQSDSNLNRFYAPNDSRTWGSTISYSESHDEERMAYKVSKFGANGVRGNNAMTMRRIGSVAAQMLMAPGAHMIWQFQEFGADQTTKQSDGGNDTSPKKVIWSYLDKPDNAGLMQSYRELFWLRRNNPDLFVNGVTTSMVCGTANWATGRFVTLRSGNKALYLVVNPNITGKITANLYNVVPSDFQLISASYGVTPTISGNAVTLPAGAYAIYGTKNLVDVPSIEADAIVKVYADGSRIVIQGDYTDASVYDMAGRRIDAKTNFAPGIYIVNVDGNTYKVAVK